MRKAALILSIVMLALPSPARASGDEPIEDLQRLFIEDTVSLINPPGPDTGMQARALMDRAGEARAAGDFARMRRLLSQARVILAGGVWDADRAFTHSLSIRPANRVIDPARPAPIFIGQSFLVRPPARKLELRLGFQPKGSTHVIWRASSSDAAGKLSGSGLSLVPPLEGLPDGASDIVLEARDGERVIGRTRSGIWIVSGIHRDLAEIARRKSRIRISGALSASLEWPANLANTLADGTRQPIDVDWRKLIARTQALLAEAEAGRDPLVRATGLHERHYASSHSRRIEPYSLYVPETWDGAARLPLVVLLHGSNSDHNRPFASGRAVELAREKGWAVLAPMGHSPNSGWGNHLPVVLANGTMPAPRPSTILGVMLPTDGFDPEPAEMDVLDAITDVRTHYPIDDGRIYLGGNSMGGEGTWHLGQRHPRTWAAIAPGAGPIDPANFPYSRLGRLPVLAVHGDADPIISFAASADMVDRLLRAGGEGELLRISGGGHSSYDPALDRIFDFFAKHSREE